MGKDCSRAGLENGVAKLRGLAGKLHKVDFLDWHGRAGRLTFAPISQHK